MLMSAGLGRDVLDGKDTDGRVGSRQQSAQLPVFQCQLVDHPHQPFSIGPDLFELGFVLLSEFLEPYDLFAEPGLGVRELSALFDLGVELVLRMKVALSEGIAGDAGLDGEGHDGRGPIGALGPAGQNAVRGGADAVALVCCSLTVWGPSK